MTVNGPYLCSETMSTAENFISEKSEYYYGPISRNYCEEDRRETLLFNRLRETNWPFLFRTNGIQRRK